MPLLLSPASSPTPSPAILDFLARLSLPLPPNSPPAPSFLCPSCQPELSSARRRRRQLPTPSSPNPAAAPLEHQQAQHLSEQVYHYNRFKTSYNNHDSSLAFVPPKYVQDSDGFWYPATSWSLHGETSKPSLLSFPTSTPPSTSLPFLPSNVVTATPSIQLDDPLLGDGDGDDDDSDFTASGSSSSPGASMVASDYDAIKDSLPTGWTLPPTRTEFYSTRVIVIVSLILAISLSLIIAGCVLGHKAKSGSHRQSFRKIPNEAKSRANAQKSLSRTSSPPPPLNVEVDTETGDPELEAISDSERAEMISKHMKKREKLWDKWRNKSGKLSDFGLRRRKKKNASINSPSVTRTIPSSPSTLAITTPPIRIVHQGASPLTSPPASSALPVVPSTSTPSGQVGSVPNQPVSSLRPSSPALNASHSLQISSSAPSLTLADPNISLVSSAQLTPSLRQPPAYRHGAAAAASDHEMSRSPKHVIQNQSREPVDINESPCPSRQSLEEYPHPEYSPPPLLSSSTTAGSPGLKHRAHLATDDKAVLELMRKGASEPLRNEDGHALTSIPSTSPRQLEATHSNAPPWIDESLEHFEELQDSKDRDQDHCGSETTSLSPPRSNLRLPPLPSADFHLRLERHYNMEALLPLSETESSTEAISLNGSEPSSLSDPNPSSSSILRPSAPPHDDDSSVSYQLRPSAPPLLSEFGGNNSADGDEENSVDTDVEQREDERQSRWDRQVDLEASLARTRSTPGTAPLVPSSSPRPHRRRSLSISSLANGSSNKRLSLPRYEP